MSQDNCGINDQQATLGTFAAAKVFFCCQKPSSTQHGAAGLLSVSVIAFLARLLRSYHSQPRAIHRVGQLT